MTFWRKLFSSAGPTATELSLDSATESCIGGRKINQDFVGGWVEGDDGIWVVADGLGGHHGSESASRVAVDAAIDAFRSEPGTGTDVLSRILARAQEAVLEAQRTNGDIRTTVAVLARRGDSVRWAHAGDTRVYRFSSANGLTHTADHSVPQMLATMGEIHASEIRHHRDRNQIVKALGQEEELNPTVSPESHRLSAGDAFLLCTDGWWEHVLDDEMAADLAEATGAGDWLGRMRERIEDRVEERHDNYTAAAVLVAQRS